MVEVGRYIRATTISVILLGVPAVGLLISALAFHETVNASLGLGVALVSAGILLTTTDLSQKWPSKAALAKR
jgi:drug/metabolite transporter (DMT)-like permease